MTAKTELSAPKRRTRAEVQQLVAEFVSSGMWRSEFCESRGLSFSTLDRHLKKRLWKRRRKPKNQLIYRDFFPAAVAGRHPFARDEDKSLLVRDFLQGDKICLCPRALA